MLNLPHTPTVLLLAPEFDAFFVTQLTTLGRQAGHPVILTGLIAGPLRSDLGLSLLPDRTLDTLTLAEPAWVVIPGPQACTQALARDPRVRRLCQETYAQGGQVFAMPAIRALVQEAGLTPPARPETTPPAPWFAALLQEAV